MAKKGKLSQPYTSYGALCLYIAFRMSYLTCGIPIFVKYRSLGALRGGKEKEEVNVHFVAMLSTGSSIFFPTLQDVSGEENLFTMSLVLLQVLRQQELQAI